MGLTPDSGPRTTRYEVSERVSPQTVPASEEEPGQPSVGTDTPRAVGVPARSDVSVADEIEARAEFRRVRD